MSRFTLSSVVVAVSLATMTTAPAGALTYDKLAYLTFNRSVQVPGITLDAGTYRFRLANPDTSRNVLQVLSNDGAIVYAMFHTIPDSRLSATEDPVVTFMETPAGVPPAIRSLFYGGELNGYAFVYPKGGPIMIAPVVPQPEITYAPIEAAAVPEAIAEPDAGAAAEPIAEPAVEPTLPSEAVPVAQAEELPRTATRLPLIAIGGLASLVTALGLSLLRRREA
jgi:hypothetical protein